MKRKNDISPRSRLGNGKAVSKSKTGRQAQTEFVEMINKMFNTINAQIEVEPNTPKGTSFHVWLPLVNEAE